MSRYSPRTGAITINDIARRKSDGKKISMVTCYDSAFARLVDLSGVDIALVGDSLGNVMLGFNDTTSVTIDHMVHHTAAVSRAMLKPFLVADMPFMSYKVSVKQALINASRLIQEGGAQAVKLEGGLEVCPQVEAIVKAGIPVMAHIGLTPQSVHAQGGFKVQGRGDAAEKLLIDSAKSLEQAGAFSIVLELIPAALAQKVTQCVGIPTIGIGAGVECDGQVLVIHDLLGFDEQFNPKFLKKYANLGKTIVDALRSYDREVKEAQFPTVSQSFSE